MSVILEFTIGARDFQLGSILSNGPKVSIELERIVPTGELVMPFVWVSDGDLDAFEAAVRTAPDVEELVVLDEIGDERLYRLEWQKAEHDLTVGITQSNAVILEATGNDEWRFRLRFADHDALSSFHSYLLENDIPARVTRTYPLSANPSDGYPLGLTLPQREALVLAAQRGYFETPSEVTLDELAAELDISRQALSSRIRRGNKTLIDAVLLASVDLEDRT